MKKVLVISIIFAIVLGLSIWEIKYNTRLFSDIHGNLQDLQQSIEASGEQVDNAVNLRLMDKIMDRWNDGKEILFCFGNHTMLRGIDEKLVSLDKMLRINYKDDAKVTVSVSIALIKAVLNDTHLVPTNLF